MGSNQDGIAQFSLVPLQEAVLQFQSDAKEFENWEASWEMKVYSGGGFESASLEAHRMSHNTRMADFETHLLDLEPGGGVSNIFCHFLPVLFILGHILNKVYISYLGGSNSSTFYLRPKRGRGMKKHTFLLSEKRSRRVIGSWRRNK